MLRRLKSIWVWPDPNSFLEALTNLLDKFQKSQSLSGFLELSPDDANGWSVSIWCSGGFENLKMTRDNVFFTLEFNDFIFDNISSSRQRIIDIRFKMSAERGSWKSMRSCRSEENLKSEFLEFPLLLNPGEVAKGSVIFKAYDDGLVERFATTGVASFEIADTVSGHAIELSAWDHFDAREGKATRRTD